jgi:hypothetical protein
MARSSKSSPLNIRSSLILTMPVRVAAFLSASPQCSGLKADATLPLGRHCPHLADASLHAENTWKLLEAAIGEINNHNASGLSFEELYRSV